MPSKDSKPKKTKKATATHFLLKGLAISLPPILTLVIIIWIGRAVNDYIIHPVSTSVRYTISQFISNAQPSAGFVEWDKLDDVRYLDQDYVITKKYQDELLERAQREGTTVKEIPKDSIHPDADQIFVPMGEWVVPYTDYVKVAERIRQSEMPTTATGIYMELVTVQYFPSLFHLSAVAVAISIMALYFLGRVVTARLGAFMVSKFERGVLGRLPVISSVYSSVKQVTDFFFSERSIEYSRVVAVEYPRRGIWSIGFVTSDSMLEITAAAGEPLVSILIPTSPMPVTGYTMSVPRSDVVDLDISIDQAFQFCVSCGVLVPDQQVVTPELLQQELAKRLAESVAAIPQTGKFPAKEAVTHRPPSSKDAPPTETDSGGDAS
jgi:uncharacterized membrane protein